MKARQNAIITPESGRRGNGFKDITGRVFGRLTVIKHVGSEITQIKPEKRKSLWEVLCGCGVTKIMRGGDLNSKKVVSCGCFKSENTRAFNTKTKTKVAYDTFSVVWQSYRAGASKRGLTFNLTKSEFYTITQCSCTYCGKAPSQIRKARVGGKLSSFVYSGIDRVDSSQGYELSNCVPCCGLCNRMKGVQDVEIFKDQIYTIYKYLNLGD